MQAATTATVAGDMCDPAAQFGLHHRSRQDGRLGTDLEFPLPRSLAQIDQRAQQVETQSILFRDFSFWLILALVIGHLRY